MEENNVQKQKKEFFSGKIDRNLFLICLAIILICITIIAGMLVQNRKNKVESRTVAFGLRDIGELVTQAGYFTTVQATTDARTLFGFDIPFRFLYKGIIIKHNKTEPTYTKTSLFLCEKRRFFMARTEKGVVATI